MNSELKHNMTEEKWHAIVNNDASLDGKFFYGVKTTGIFCRPSCKSRIPNIENVLIFPNVEHALAEQFRPCKRCKPGGLLLPDADWIEMVSSYIESNYKDKLTLKALAAMCHGSPYHMQRTFKRLKGITPNEYIQKMRISKAIELLTCSDMAVKNINKSLGIKNTAHFATLFKKMTGYTPTEYRLLFKKGGLH